MTFKEIAVLKSEFFLLKKMVFLTFFLGVTIGYFPVLAEEKLSEEAIYNLILQSVDGKSHESRSAAQSLLKEAVERDSSKALEALMLAIGRLRSASAAGDSRLMESLECGLAKYVRLFDATKHEVSISLGMILLYENSTLIQHSLCFALANAKSKCLRAPLERLLTSENVGVCANAVYALRTMGHFDILVNHSKLLENTHWRVRYEIACGLATLWGVGDVPKSWEDSGMDIDEYDKRILGPFVERVLVVLREKKVQKEGVEK